MRRSLFATFRGSDGRSLAWALALLLLVNAFVAGANIGFAATPGAVLCAVGDTHGASGAPGSPGHADPCCLAGCVTSAAGIDAQAAGLRLPAFSFVARGLPSNSAAVALPHRAGHGPRGPPLLT